MIDGVALQKPPQQPHRVAAPRKPPEEESRSGVLAGVAPRTTFTFFHDVIHD